MARLHGERRQNCFNRKERKSCKTNTGPRTRASPARTTDAYSRRPPLIPTQPSPFHSPAVEVRDAACQDSPVSIAAILLIQTGSRSVKQIDD